MAAQVRGYTSKKPELKRCKIITYNTSLKFILYTTAITKVHPTQYPHKQFKLNCIVTNVSIQPLSKTLHKLQKKTLTEKLLRFQRLIIIVTVREARCEPTFIPQRVSARRMFTFVH